MIQSSEHSKLFMVIRLNLQIPCSLLSWNYFLPNYIKSKWELPVFIHVPIEFFVCS